MGEPTVINLDRYGPFPGAATISQEIKRIMHAYPKFDLLSAEKREALDEIANRIGRIVNGNPTENKPWEEIRNYSNLVLGA